jgi:hypothetical protein
MTGWKTKDAGTVNAAGLPASAYFDQAIFPIRPAATDYL